MQIQLKELFKKVRKASEDICSPLATEDYVVQTVLEVSPPKWHLAHTSWFYETLILKKYLSGYKEFNPKYNTFFNSYYKSLGKHWLRDQRGLLSRPSVSDVYEYRKYVDENVEKLLSTDCPNDALKLIELGLHHEQQHQELLLMDIKNIYYVNGMAYQKELRKSSKVANKELSFSEGVYEFGYDGSGFHYDNEGPRNKQYLNSFKLDSAPVTNRDYLNFINNGGYENELLWLSDGLTYILNEDIKSPLYWKNEEGKWMEFTLAGWNDLDLYAPVSHLSYYEAQAYAQWMGKRLPTEFEWELAAKEIRPESCNLLEENTLTPYLDENYNGLIGNLWEWTASSYDPYPGYKREAGPLGEYNGKFMCNQRVLKGGSFATAKWHYRDTYRNFFYPRDRWQFSGLRLAKDS